MLHLLAQLKIRSLKHTALKARTFCKSTSIGCRACAALELFPDEHIQSSLTLFA